MYGVNVDNIPCMEHMEVSETWKDLTSEGVKLSQGRQA